MSLFAKPYNALQKIQRSIFSGKPNVYADVDINAQILRQLYSLKNMQNTMGLIGSFTVTNASTYVAGNQLQLNVSWTSCDVVHTAMRFQVAAGSIVTIVPVNNYPQIRLYLIAKKKIVTFVDDPVMSGVNGSTLTSPIPSADHEVYYAERIGYGGDGFSPVSLAIGEEIICPIGSVIPMFDKAISAIVPKFYSHTLSAYSEKVKTILGVQSFDSTSIVELNQMVLDFLYNYKSEPLGTVKMYSGLTTKFDNSGLGLSEWGGWAFMNGINGTSCDARGRSAICYDNRTSDPFNSVWDPAYNTIGGFFGEKSHILLIPELPRHDFYVIKTGSARGLNIGFLGDDSVARDNAGEPSNREYRLDPVTGPADEGKTNIVGGDAAHNTVHPSFVTMYVQRVL